ncbi:hypothetical protein TUBRATIS_24720 [Tubulinosema ratisbonensis]|uniref:Uncharacterized protein n=1 Tax=Tubulinosema ratisbonensis TaxID=291195 RepID=A0A437AIU9_9MICR|nr:hypothetical protein TUBRATIS_24720 [Tubulinosema ratisbonensis]
MDTNYKENNLKKKIVLLWVVASTLKLCLASLGTKNELMSDLTLDDTQVKDNPKLLPKNKKQKDFLQETLEITRLMGIARLLHYSTKQHMRHIQHPLAKNLCIIFDHFDQSSSDKKQVVKALNELKRILFNPDDTTYPDGVLTQTYFFRIFFILGQFLTDPNGKKLYDRYQNNPLLKENFVFDKWYGKDNKLNFALSFFRSIDTRQFLHEDVPQKNVFHSDLSFNSLYPKYLYFNVDLIKRKKVEFLDMKKVYQFEYIDQHKVCSYRAVGFLTRERRKVHAYLYENSKWTEFMNDNKSSKFIIIPCPLVVVYEKYAEYHRVIPGGD